ncbi:peroxiredoxin [Metamycoplasma neophronis]|uniref:Peroxiredoxin n=1 Tax=Metamycoplasma neophronis TaxID=872983 RepID=A0ABY2Z060_9BACT|nr:peroxiredoxin [Metamycoplasma neophronis]TPR53706.1 peroxiredoxin [Metamycoplasma neophronis]
MSLINKMIIDFETKAFQKDKGIFTVTQNDIKNNENIWTILFFYPADFTSVCNSEILDLNKILPEIKKENIQVFAASCDTVYSHSAWVNQNETNQAIKLTFLDDKNTKISSSLGIYNPENGLAYRGTFIISPEGIIKAYEIHDVKIGRDVKEDLRKAKAAKYANDNNSACTMKEIGR